MDVGNLTCLEKYCAAWPGREYTITQSEPEREIAGTEGTPSGYGIRSWKTREPQFHFIASRREYDRD